MSIRKVDRALLVMALAGMLTSGCGIADLVDDLKGLEDQFDNPDGGFDLPEDDSDGGAPERQLEVEQASEILDDQGGQLATEAGGIDVPAGALTTDTEVSVAEVSAEQIVAKLPSVLHAVAPAVAFTPHGQTFTKPVTLSLFHEGTSADLVVLRLDDESDTEWERVDATFAAGVAYVTSTHFSIYNVSQCAADSTGGGTCSGLVGGSLGISDVPKEEFSDFQPPKDFGSPGVGGGSTQPGAGGDPSDGEDCKFETVCQVISSCRPLEGEPGVGGGSTNPVPGDEKPACMEIEEEICWDECVTGGDTTLPGGDVCDLPIELKEGCRLEASDGACPFEVRCDGGGIMTGPQPSDPGQMEPEDCVPVPPGCTTQKAPDAPCGRIVIC